jgi:hypothetical protein
MPEKKTIERARRAKQQGKSASTQSGEFVREEIHHVREGKHGARSTKQAIAIGLSKARRAGVNLPPPKKGTVSEKTRRSAESAYKRGQRGAAKSSGRRARASGRALEREGRKAASKKSLARQARSAGRRRTSSARSASAKQAARTKGRSKRSSAARKAARARARNR